MDFALELASSPELSAFTDEVRAFLTEEMRDARHLKWSATWSTRANEEEYSFRRNLARKLGARGWLFPTFPVEYGGAGLTSDHLWILSRELDAYGIDLMTPFYTLASLVAPCMLVWGTDEQKR